VPAKKPAAACKVNVQRARHAHAGFDRFETKGRLVMPDIGKLIDAIERRLAALDMNSRQAAQVAVQQLNEIAARSGAAASDFHEHSERAVDVDHTLSWHVTLVRRMFAQTGKKAGG
jgi:hypothetical protein